jgi:hypothetical protein
MIDERDELANLTELINNHRPTLISNRLMNEESKSIFNLTLSQLIDFYLKLDNEDKICMFETNLNPFIHYCEELEI